MARTGAETARIPGVDMLQVKARAWTFKNISVARRIPIKALSNAEYGYQVAP